MPTHVGESKTLKSALKILMLMLTEHYGAYKKKVPLMVVAEKS